ncbi:helix-turn-helix domain-containing protein [Fibrella forsythiae]|uniref:Helix-turn-helix transcriptional regulator n=1 Tax=Fibrella forsythiae TaxID=2817061 RepID=A0ABS3JSE7_9BACT|nr:helix-turn-helix transcriptional regulator [Fibrella forsythiae]MBO0952931.1 helix-turn-helix transcriptional regulator [Fibrella forsythiae]
MSAEQQDIKRQVANLIREARKAKGLTQKELGDMIGVAESTFSRFEKGGQNLTLDTLQRISVALGVSLFIDFK